VVLQSVESVCAEGEPLEATAGAGAGAGAEPRWA
jgi:hypothetical protein